MLLQVAFDVSFQNDVAPLDIAFSLPLETEKKRQKIIRNTQHVFQKAEKKQYRAEQYHFEMKHQRRLEEARATSAANIKEFEQLQNEKHKMLHKHFTLFIL